MTTIRKIVTSKIDGSSADSTNTTQIRPFGEIAVYVNTEPNPDKLTLMMFDGTRTNLKSMVLAPGRLYGSDADSGDGNNRDTIKLIPDASLSDYTGNDQYLIIDPTGGNIHIRAGGTIDNSDADLYLGGEKTFVRVSDTTDDVVIRTGLNALTENVVVDVVDELVPPGGVWRMFFLDTDYPNLGTTVQVGDTVTTSWGTPITATITNIVQDTGADTWALHFDQDITAGFDNGDTVTFNRGLEVLLITTRLSKTWTFDNTGKTVLPGTAIFNGTAGIVVDNLNAGIAGLFNDGDVYITGGNSVRFTGIDESEGFSTSVLRFWNAEGRHSSGNDPTELATLGVGNDAAPGAPTEGFLTIVTEKETGGDKTWKFDANGVLTLPAGGNIVDSTGASVLGGGTDPNIWIQTFASQDGFPSDVVSLATSVEYDNAGNIIALFSHQTGIGEFNVPSGSYFSVAKFTAAGQKLWQVRLTAGISSVYTDGWGLAVDNVDGRIYVAGRVNDEVGYSKSSLIKLNSEDGGLIWSNVYDFGDRSDSPVVDVDSDGNPVMVGFYSTEVDTNDGVTVTKIDRLDGTVIWSRLLDGQNDDEAYGMAVGPNNEVVAVGYMAQYDEPVSHPVTPQTGSGVNVLVINRSDLSGDTLTDAWEVAGTGITGTIGVNAINVYTGLTGTVREGSGATFDFVIAGDGSITNPVTVANGGTNYLVGHKIKIPYTLIGGADANSDIILTVTGATDGVITSVAAGFFGGGSGSPNNYYSAIGTNYQTGSGLEFDLELDSGSTYTEHPFNITAVGSNYVDGDVVTISGALLGGTSPDNDLTTTVSTSAGGVSTFNSFTGTQQTTTYRVRTDDFDVDFSGTGTWTLSGILVDNDDRMLVVKYDSTGTIAWQKAIQFDAGYSCRGADADIDSQGNVYVCGNYDYDANGEQNSAMNLVKFDSSGVKQWSRRVVGDCEDFATSIVVGPDDTLYLNGITSQLVNNTPRFVWVVAKYTTSGTVVWQRLIENTTGWSFSGGGFFNAGGGSNLAVRQGYVVLSGGFGEPFFGTSAAAVVQIDADGTVFNVGDWEFKAASFSGTLNSDASDITVVNAEKVDSAITGIIVDDTLFGTDTTNFLIPTLYTAPSGDSSLVNGAYTVALGNTGAVTLPAGGTITEGYVTSNPTIQLTPASPDVASQKLVIKGGGAYTYTDNGISINYNNNTAIVGNTLTFYINSNTYADQTLYWWIYPEGANISDPGSGTVAINEFGYGSFSFDLDSDDNEFTVRVSPEADNYDPASTGVETGLINPDAPTFDSEHHLHLTTGDLSETSIILGTDNHNVRTMVNGDVEINTFLYPEGGGSGKWTFDTNGLLTFPNGSLTMGHGQGDAITSTDALFIYAEGGLGLSCAPTGPNLSQINLGDQGNINIRSVTASSEKYWYFNSDGSLTVPGDIRSEGNINIDINLSDSTLRRWQFGEDGDLTFPNGLTMMGGAPSLLVDTGNNFGIGTSRLQSQSAVCSIAVGDEFVADTEFNDDITVVQVGWTVVVDGTTYTVTSIDPSPPAWQYRITAAGATFVQGTTYTFTNPTPIPYAWVFGNDGTLTTPGSGTIRHQDNDLIVEVTGTDVIVLRTDGGDLAVTSGGDLQFNDGTIQTTALVQGEQVFTLDTGAIDYAPTVVDFNLLFVTPAIGYSGTDPTSVTLPAGVPGQRLVIFNGYNLATLTVNPGLLGRDISSGVVAEFIYSGFDGLWIPLYGTNSPT